jgi:hypothetical protein
MRCVQRLMGTGMGRWRNGGDKRAGPLAAAPRAGYATSGSGLSRQLSAVGREHLAHPNGRLELVFPLAA